MLPYGVRTFLQRIPPCGTRQRSSAIGGQFNTSGEERNRATDDTDKTHIKSKRRRDVHQKDRDHRQRDDQLGQHAADVSEQASPPRATGINHSFASDEFTCDGTDHRANKQADHSEEETNQRADNRPESAPLGRSEIFRPKIAAEKIEQEGKNSEK